MECIYTQLHTRKFFLFPANISKSKPLTQFSKSFSVLQGKAALKAPKTKRMHINSNVRYRRVRKKNIIEIDINIIQYIIYNLHG
jgi:hypothetical protein